MTDQHQSGKDQWGSRIGVILAVAGSAVGLGNFLRFPGQAAANGGGAFMLPYFVSLLILGIPLCWAEWTMGRYGGIRGHNSAPAIFTCIWPHRASKYIGGIALLIPLVIYMYYVLIEAWCLSYALFYLRGDLTDPALIEGADGFGGFFGQFTGQGEDGALLAEGEGSLQGRNFLWVLLGTFVFNFTLIYRGVSKGIETFCKVAMPSLVILAVIVLIRVLTLGDANSETGQLHSVNEGLGFMWNPQGDKLRDPQTWLAASGQIFFSLSVGFGIIVNYASYLKRNDDVVLSGLTSSSMNEFFEVCLGGLITLPAAFIFLGVAAGSYGTFGLGFVALPSVFAAMPGGQVFGFLWFFMLFVAAVTSSVSMLQPVIAFLEEGFALRRHASAAILGLLAAFGTGFVLYFSKDVVALDMFDFWVGSVLIFLLALFQSLLYGWVFGIDRGEQEAHQGAHLKIPRFVQYMIKYVIPVYLLVIFAAFCWEKIPSQDELLFTVDRDQVTHFDPWRVTPAFEAALEEHDAEFPAEFVVTPSGTGRWKVRNAAKEVIYTVRQHGQNISFYRHTAGYAERILLSRAAFASVAFLGLVLGFLMVLINIAGKRWQAEGRFANRPSVSTGEGEGI